MKRFIFFITSLVLCFSINAAPDEEKKVDAETQPDPYIYRSVNVISGQYSENQIDLHLLSPKPLELRRYYFPADSYTQGWHFNYSNILYNSEEDSIEEKKKDHIHMEVDEKNRLKSLVALDLTEEIVYNSLHFNYHDADRLECEINSDNGDRVKYIFDKFNPSRTLYSYVLDKVILNDDFEVDYHYRDHPKERKKLISKREETGGHFLELEYYDNFANDVGGDIVFIKDLNRDDRIGRVKLQKEPVGIDNTPIITARFFYQQGFTEVFDALNRRVVYRFGKLRKLSNIEHYLEEDSLYRTERFFWNDKGLLTAKAIEDGGGHIHSLENFVYDKYDNVVNHTLYGNLSGTNTSSITLDIKGNQINPDVEKYTTLSRYSDDDFHLLLLQKFDNGKVIRYNYLDKTSLLTEKITYDNEKIILREFFDYDKHGHLIKKILDDGSTISSENLEDITERQILYFSPRLEKPAIGMPEEISEYFLDLKTDSEILKKRVLFHYGESGHLIKQVIKDPIGNTIFCQDSEFDSFGRPVKVTDKTGDSTIKSFDIFGRVISSEGQDIKSKYLYDNAGRLIWLEEDFLDGKKTSTNLSYDYVGNKIASTDIFGNSTNYEYDSLNRLIKTTYPEVQNSDGQPCRPKEFFEYDVFNRMVSHTDTNGYTTKKSYNVMGQVIEIIYPDETCEKFEYNLDGTLKRSFDKWGGRVEFIRDASLRAVEEEHYSCAGDLIKSKERRYSAFHLLSESVGDASVEYNFDCLGESLEIRENRCKEMKSIQLLYDTAGNLISKKEFDFDDSLYLTTEILRDDNDRVESVIIKNRDGKIIRKADNLQEEEKKTKAYVYDYFNSRGQNVLQTIEADSNGCMIKTTFDAMARAERIEKRDTLGQVINAKEIRYDAMGNKVKEIHDVISSQKSTYKIVSAWEYGPMGRLESSIEAFNTACEKKTLYIYNTDGTLQATVKPDGVEIFYEYSATGQISRLYSSDNSVDYRYEYDLNGNLTLVDDSVLNRKTIREYDLWNNIVFEELGTGLFVENEYDRQGRRKGFILPDLSKILYRYDVFDLRAIERVTSDNISLYTHDFTTYNLKGQLAEAEMIEGLGSVRYSYDDKGSLQDISTSYWCQELNFDSSGLLVEANIEDFLGKTKAAYQYNDRNQVTCETGFAENRFSYDSVHNRTSKNCTNYTFDELNQMVRADTEEFVYDDNGNLIEIDDSNERTRFKYDALNRLVKVIVSDLESIIYTYDSFDRRLTKEVMYNDQRINFSRYIYDGLDEIGAIDEDGKIYELRVFANHTITGQQKDVAIEIGGEIYAPIQNHIGSTTSLINAKTKEVDACYRYSSFGEIEDGLSVVDCPWLFLSKRYEKECDLIFFGKRYYSPKHGRWITKDPIGTPESVNRYAYCLNQPVTRIDSLGLFSFENSFNAFFDFMKSAFEFSNQVVHDLRYAFSFERNISPYIEPVARELFGASFLNMSGFYHDQSGVGVHGRGEVSDRVRITLINGILNARGNFKDSLELLSQTHGGVNIHYIFDATRGWTGDMVNAVMVKLGYVSPQARTIAQTWKTLIGEMGGVDGGGLIIHYSHSIGTTHTKAALKMMSEEERQMIRIYTFGSPSMIYSDGIEGVKNFISKRDGVCLFDPVGFLLGLFGLSDDVVLVGNWLGGLPFVDHTLYNSTYIEVMRMLGNQFLQEFLIGSY